MTIPEAIAELLVRRAVVCDKIERLKKLLEFGPESAQRPAVNSVRCRHRRGK